MSQGTIIRLNVATARCIGAHLPIADSCEHGYSVIAPQSWVETNQVRIGAKPSHDSCSNAHRRFLTIGLACPHVVTDLDNMRLGNFRE